MSARFETASLVEGQGSRAQDRVLVRVRGSIAVGVVADGAGGTSGGAEAASLVVERVTLALDQPADLLDMRTWQHVLRQLGTRLESEGIGQTTAVIAATDGTHVVGASVGDSCAWLVGDSDVRDLTAGQPRKPLLGGGNVEPFVFTQEIRLGETLLLATDGLWKYTTAERIRSSLCETRPSLEAHCGALVSLARLPSGRLQDDAGVVVVRFSVAAQLLVT